MSLYQDTADFEKILMKLSDTIDEVVGVPDEVESIVKDLICEYDEFLRGSIEEAMELQSRHDELEEDLRECRSELDDMEEELNKLSAEVEELSKELSCYTEK